MIIIMIMIIIIIYNIYIIYITCYNPFPKIHYPNCGGIYWISQDWLATVCGWISQAARELSIGKKTPSPRFLQFSDFS
jgi:hypothetical protein